MRTRRLLLACVCAAGLVIVVWAPWAGQPVRPGGASPSSGDAPRASAGGTAVLPGFGARSGGRIGGRAIEPRLFASLSALAGESIVSVRQVFAEDRVRTLLSPHIDSSDGVGRVQLVMQVLNQPGSPSGVEDLDPRSVAAVDSTGRRLRPATDEDLTNSDVPIQGGRIHSLLFEGAGRTVQSLRSVTGRILSVEDPGAPPADFRIENVPLPNAARLFGEATVVLLSVEAAMSLPRDDAVLVGAQADRIVDRALPHPDAAQLPPQMLVIASGLPAVIGPSFLGALPETVVTATPEPSGRIRFGVGVRGLGPAWHGRVWDGDRFLVPLPATRRDGARWAAALRLTRQAPAASREPDNVAPFPAGKDGAGGALVVSVLIDGRALGQGRVWARVWKRREADMTGPELTIIHLDQAGQGVLANMAPGSYRVELDHGSLVPLVGGTELNLRAYIAARFGVTNGAWARGTTQSVEVLPGRRTYLVPLTWLSRRGSRS